MPSSSVNTNVGAMIALQNLNKTNVELATTQNRINTGLKVGSAKDNGAIWAIAQSQRSEVAALTVVQTSLDRGKSAVDVAMAAGEGISDLLIQLKEKALAAKDSSINTAARTALNEDFKSIRDQIGKTVSNAQFNGVNLLKSGAVAFKALANADGSSTVDVAAEIMKLSGAVVTVTTTDVIDTLTKAAAVLTKVDASIANVSASLARMGTSSKALDTHRNFVSRLADALSAGVGNLVDADLAKESAKLQALQTKQQLGVQALSIANQSSSILLGLFR